MRSSGLFLSLSSIAAWLGGLYAAPAGPDCTGTISSLDDVDAAVACTTVVINAFTVPGGQTFNLDLLDGTTITMAGDVTFGEEVWEGPLFQISGDDITCEHDIHLAMRTDGLGGAGSTKPDPMMKIKISGTYTNVKVLNSPQRVYSVSNPGTMSQLTIDNSAGDAPNDQSNGGAAGHNTDGFDCSTTDLLIQDSTIMNQDDCLAINKGSNITLTRNHCSGGHGISIGSISSDATVSGVTITDNVITNNDQALRIKTKADAADTSVSDVT
ncbi:pectin lyase fold/virulence factor, partial [Amylostereum chailletii]